ncbi:hypothetical protein [Streptomyces sp. Wh19]|uniref:Uncharacterized protein n=1 Tax=Streptomyces sanglieri TaxID=193460 RepID=A0ABW2X930_9ACTN|nr:hypothetical protein [Streptomyces sp. Wh19]MDV9196985.1 hypothetical protein [Streptomyces sp. Wh19]
MPPTRERRKSPATDAEPKTMITAPAWGTPELGAPSAGHRTDDEARPGAARSRLRAHDCCPPSGPSTMRSWALLTPSSCPLMSNQFA